MAGLSECEYQLSSEILGHSADVRVVRSFQLHESGVPSTQHVITASRDGTACVWRSDEASKNEYILKKVMRQHVGYVSALCVIPPDPTAGRTTRKRH